MATLRAARDLVQALLRELDPETRLVEFEEHPDGLQVVLRIEPPNEVGKSVAVPRRAIVQALGDERVRTTLRDTLRAALAFQPARQDPAPVREAAEGPNAGIPPCPVCGRRIVPGDSVIFERGTILHLCCPVA
ncbi:MAG: hypothetical protein ACREMB_08450 [Candidatus Rokuibacteriota bacterium]